jgi:phage terminase large subunit GpA-like protein
VEPLDAMSVHSEYEQVCLMWAAQLSKTTLTLAALAESIVEDPGPCLVVQPNLNMAEVWSKQRLAPMCRDMPALKGIVADPKSRDSGSTVFSRSFRGGHVSVASAGSPAGLASRPIRFLILDETDRFEASAGAEGSPSSLAIARTRTYKASRKILWTSTPTIKGESEIAAVYAESDQREYEVPCPRCRHFQVLVWPGVEWPEGHPELAFYRCAGCEQAIEHHLKDGIVAVGRWVARNPGARIAGFHLNELVSPWRSWGELAIDWMKAQGSIERLRSFINTSLAECFSDEATGAVGEKELLSRVEPIGPMVPDAAAVITCGVDVQDNRLEAFVYAHGRAEECWMLARRVIPGDPSTPGLWAALDAFLLTTWAHPVLGPVPIHATCIDSGGHYTQGVCSFADARRGRRVFAVKGIDGARPVWPKRESRAAKGKVFLIGVDSVKQAIMHRLKITEPGPGRIHYPTTCDLQFFEQLCSEYLQTTYKRGRPERHWVRKKGRAAEVLDGTVYAFAAVAALRSHGIDVDAECERVRLMADANRPGVSGLPYQVNRSRFLSSGL